MRELMLPPEMQAPRPAMRARSPIVPTLAAPTPTLSHLTSGLDHLGATFIDADPVAEHERDWYTPWEPRAERALDGHPEFTNPWQPTGTSDFEWPAAEMFASVPPPAMSVQSPIISALSLAPPLREGTLTPASSVGDSG
jgi:hypothetical protein